MTQLNREQQAAAEFINGVASVVAVPGSGKTLTMTHRIGNLVKKGVSPESILGLTFTRNAAQAMRDKLSEVLEGAAASRVHLSTIHSFCMTLLRNEGKSFQILQGKDQLVFIRKIMRTMKVNNLPTGMVLREISLAKSNLIAVDEFTSLYEGDPTMLKVADVFRAYEEDKKKRLFLDFDDLLLETHQLLKHNQDVRQKYQESFRHVTVDEFQDTTPIQMEILQLIVGTKANDNSLWVCADDWQSIYSFAGASVGNILNFKDMFPDSSQFILKVNYRSTPEILKACMNLIKNNVKKIEKKLETKNPKGTEPVVVDAESEEDEATRIVTEILDLVERGRFSHKDIAILYRANFQSRAIEEAFIKAKVPYHIENGMNFYQRKEVKGLLDYLTLIQNPASEEGGEALRSIINTPNRYISRKFVSELEDFCLKKEVHLWEGLKGMRVEVPYLKHNIKIFREILNPLIKDAPKMHPSEVVSILRETLNWDAHVAEDEIPSPDDSKVANLNEFQMVAGRFEDIPSLLNYAETFKEDLSNDVTGVSLMTIHKAKGLEFPVVFIPGLIEGILPNKQADIEEERRVCFVGMSRAMKLLYLTYPHTRGDKTVKRSSFLDEILNREPPH